MPHGEVTVNIGYDHPLAHWATARYPCPEIHEQGCVALSVALETDYHQISHDGHSAHMAATRDAFLVYDCGARRRLQETEINELLLRGRWEPDIQWIETVEDGLHRINGTTVCIHGTTQLTMSAMWTESDGLTLPTTTDTERARAREAVTRAIYLEECGCRTVGETLEAIQDHVNRRYFDHAEVLWNNERLSDEGVHVDAGLVAYSLGLSTPDTLSVSRIPFMSPEREHRGEWVDNPEILDGDLNMELQSVYTTTPEEAVHFDGGPGLTLDELLGGVERIDRAIERIDETLEEVADDE